MFNILNWLWISTLLTFGYIYFYIMLTKTKITFNLKTLNSFLSVTIILAIVEYSNPFLINSFGYLLLFSLISYPFLIYTLNSSSLKYALYYNLALWFYEVIIIAMIVLSTALLDKLNLISFMEDIYIFTSIHIIFAMFIIGAHLKFVKKFIINRLETLKKITISDLYFLYFMGITLLLSLVLILNLTTYKEEILISGIIILVIFLIVVILKQTDMYLENKRLNKVIVNNTIKYEDVAEKFSLLKHNITSKLDSIKSITNNDTKELINNLIYEVNDKEKIGENLEIDCSGLKGLIIEKLIPYQDDLNIKLKYNIKSDVYEYLTPKAYNAFISSIMLALDNAIESSLKSTAKLLVICLDEEEQNFNVEIKNSHNSELNLEVLGTKHYSTKGHKRGLGLYSILNEPEIKTNIKIVNDNFIVAIFISKNKISK